jgi:hypothetical protein
MIWEVTMSRAMMFLVIGLLLAVPASACVPQASSETPSGADASQASKIQEILTASGGTVSGRPTQIPAGMGGTIPLDNGGQAGNGTTAGNGTKDPVSVTGGQGTAPDGSTVAAGPNGTFIVTIPAGKEGKVKGGIFDNGKEARDGAQGTLAGGGTITTTKDPKPNPNGGFDLEEVTKVTPGTGPDAGFRTSGGSPVPAGATTGVTVGPGKDLLDANYPYGE